MPKLIVEFNEPLTRILDELAGGLGITNVEVVKRAVVVYEHLERETGVGRELLVGRSDKELSITGAPSIAEFAHGLGSFEESVDAMKRRIAEELKATGELLRAPPFTPDE